MLIVFNSKCVLLLTSVKDQSMSKTWLFQHMFEKHPAG